MQHADQIGWHVEHDDVHRRRAADHHQNADAHLPQMTRHQLAKRAAFTRRGLMRFIQRAADIKPDRSDQQTAKERDAPAPAFQIGRREEMRQQKAAQRADQRRGALARQLPANQKAACGLHTRLHQQRGRRADLAAGREALQQSAEHDQQRRKQADLRISGRKADGCRAERHQPNGQRHRRLTAGPVRVVTDQDAAQRPHHETDAEGGDRHQQRAKGRMRRKIQLADQDREEAVDREVEHLQAVAQRGRGDQRELRGARLSRRLC